MGGSNRKGETLKEIAENVKPNTDYHEECILDDKQMKYVNNIYHIVNDIKALPKGPSKILDHLYLGNCSDAGSIQSLKELGVTHVCNTVENDTLRNKERYDGEFQYFGFSSDDHPRYPILNHFNDVFNFIEDARKNNGICFIHCMAGINRSGCLATAYVMVYEATGPITAAEKVFKARGMLLSNSGFIKQLVKFADERSLLELDKKNVKHNVFASVPQYYENWT